MYIKAFVEDVWEAKVENISILLHELLLVIPDGESSNQIDELFNELSRWNDILKDTSIGMKPPSP